MTNYYGQSITPSEYFEGEHIPNVPPIAGLPPVCSCGWTRHGGFEMSDHLAEMREAIAQIRADHAYLAAQGGKPCSCKWCTTP